MKILVTGAAGAIGFHLLESLVKQVDVKVVGIDNINDYYDVNLKYACLQEFGTSWNEVKTSETSLLEVQSPKYDNYRFLKLDITNLELLQQLFKNELG